MISRLFDDPGRFSAACFTPVRPAPPSWRLDGRGLFFAGSCFAASIHEQFAAAGLCCAVSPFGNIYNPLSMAEAAAMLTDKTTVGPEDLFLSGDTYRHFMFHTAAGGTDQIKTAETLSTGIRTAGNFLQKAEAAVLTLGTAAVYEKITDGKVVNNCHKLPPSSFNRRLLSVSEAADSITAIIGALKKANPGIRIIFTVSPVRHLRDDACDNSVSKATLLVAVREAVSGNPDCWYFPSYEIMMDELRDYRWYARDLCHPSEEAVDYITARFIDSVFSDRFKGFLRKYIPVLQASAHRPINPGSDDFRLFQQKNEAALIKLQTEYGDLFSVAAQSLNP